MWGYADKLETKWIKVGRALPVQEVKLEMMEFVGKSLQVVTWQVFDVGQSKPLESFCEQHIVNVI